MNEEGRYQREIVSAIFSALILEILGEYERIYHLQPDMTIRHESLSDRFFRLLALHFREEHTVHYYADRLNLTPKYLSTAIKRITGRPILDWIHEALLIEAAMLQHMLRGTDTCGAEVVGTEHHEHLLGLAGRYGLDVGQRLVGDGTRHTAVHHVVVAEGFPPLVHIGDAVTYKYCLLLIYRKHLERVVPMVTEWGIGKGHGGCA